jgi:hypothetical protein
MKRRHVIAALGGAAILAPLPSIAQQSEPVRSLLLRADEVIE